MTQVKEKKVKAKKSAETESSEILKDVAYKVSVLWKIMDDQTAVLNDLRREVDRINTRMGLWE